MTKSSGSTLAPSANAFDMDFDSAFDNAFAPVQQLEIVPAESENIHFAPAQHLPPQPQQPQKPPTQHHAQPVPHSQHGQQIPPVQQAKSAAQVVTVQPHAVSDGNAISMDLGIDIPGVVVEKVGAIVTRHPIERIKFTAQKKERISVILDQVIVCKTHWHDDIGSIICNGGLCCDHLGLPSVKYIFPILHYDGTDKIGKLISSEFSVKIMALSSEVYKELLTLVENKGNLSQFDLIATCSDEKWQKVSFIEVGKARWRSSDKVRAAVDETLRRHSKRLLAAIGQSYTDDQLAKKLGVDVAPGYAETAPVDFDEVFA